MKAEPKKPDLPPELQAAAEDRGYAEGLAAVEKYKAAVGPAASTKAIFDSIEQLQRNVTALHEIRAFGYARASSQKHTAVAFLFADEALKRGCLDDADRVYRRLVEFYVGDSYSGIRDRARIGIDDVRARRTAAPAPVTR